MARRVALIVVVLAGALVAPAGAGEALRHWPVSVAGPSQFELTFGQVRFTLRDARHRPSLRLAATTPSGVDYVAAALPRHQPRGALVALVLVVNRRPASSAAADPAKIALRATLSRPLGGPVVSAVDNVYTSQIPTPQAICALYVDGALPTSGLVAVLHEGTALSGFGTRAAVAQGFDQACGRAVDPAFTAQIAQTTPTPTSTTPTPIPPPRCPPCGPITQAPTHIECPLTPAQRVVACPQ
jgi:hypothetical protein